MSAAPSPRVLRTARVFGAVAFAASATRHALLVVEAEGDVARHGLFVGINLAAATLLVFRSRLAFYPMIALAAQQMWSHGHDLVASFDTSFDVMSLAVCIFFPALLTVLFIERRQRAIRA